MSPDKAIARFWLFAPRSFFFVDYFDARCCKTHLWSLAAGIMEMSLEWTGEKFEGCRWNILILRHCCGEARLRNCNSRGYTVFAQRLKFQFHAHKLIRLFQKTREGCIYYYKYAKVERLFRVLCICNAITAHRLRYYYCSIRNCGLM